MCAPDGSPGLCRLSVRGGLDRGANRAAPRRGATVRCPRQLGGDGRDRQRRGRPWRRGVVPTATISSFPPSSTVPPFTVHQANDGVVQQAHTDAVAANTALSIQGLGTVLPDNLATVGALGPGIYSFVTGAADYRRPRR